MTIRFVKKFEKHLKQLPRFVQDKALMCIERFVANPTDPLLRNHLLKGRLAGKRAFYVSANIRIIFMELDGYTLVLMLDIGTHDQMYR